MGFLKQAFNFVGSPSHSRTVGIIIILFILAIVPLTVVVSQQQQEIRQQAAGQYCNTYGQFCPIGQECNYTSCDTSLTFDCEGTCILKPTPTPTPTTAPTPSPFCDINKQPWLKSGVCGQLQCPSDQIPEYRSCPGGSPVENRCRKDSSCPTPTSTSTPTSPPAPPPPAPTPTPTPKLISTEKSCSEAPLKLTLSPNPAFVGGTFNATAFFGLSVCRNYFVNFDKWNTTKKEWEAIDSCIIDINGKCEQTFPSLAGSYRATIDKNDNGAIEPKDGEEDRNTLSVIIAPTPTLTPLPTPILTPTPAPGSILLALSLTLEGIGANRTNLPTNIAVSPVTIEVLNSSDKVVLTKTDKVVYQSKNGKFERKVDIGNTLPKDDYTIKIKIGNFLRKLVQNVFTVEAGQLTQTIEVSTTLLAGDINKDNEITIADYSALINCFGVKFNTSACADKGADLNYDKAVDGIDYNIVVRNFGKSDD